MQPHARWCGGGGGGGGGLRIGGGKEVSGCLNHPSGACGGIVGGGGGLAGGVSGDCGGTALGISGGGITCSGVEVGAAMTKGVSGIAVAMRSSIPAGAGSILLIRIVGFSPAGELAVKLSGN